MAGDKGYTVPSPVHRRPDPAGFLRRWLHKELTAIEMGVQEAGTAGQPLIPAQKDRVPNYNSPTNLPRTPVGNPTLEEQAAGPKSGSPGNVTTSHIQRGITSTAEDGILAEI